MLDETKRRTLSDNKLLELPLNKFISSIDYSWEEKWERYKYSNEEKTFLIIKNLERALQLRPDIVESVYEKLILLNNGEDVQIELEKLLEDYQD